jgi:hypothetical protein
LLFGGLNQVMRSSKRPNASRANKSSIHSSAASLTTAFVS